VIYTALDRIFGGFLPKIPYIVHKWCWPTLTMIDGGQTEDSRCILPNKLYHHVKALASSFIECICLPLPLPLLPRVGQNHINIRCIHGVVCRDFKVRLYTAYIVLANPSPYKHALQHRAIIRRCYLTPSLKIWL